MRRFISILLATCICLSMCSCASETNQTGERNQPIQNTESEEIKQPIFKDPKQEAFEISREAYESINDACDILEEIGLDVYEAWRLAIDNKADILNSPCAYLADKLKLNEDEIRMGVAFCNLSFFTGVDWEEVPEDKIKENIEYADNFFYWKDYSLFVLCIGVISSTYQANGEFFEVETALNHAKEQMKKLTADFSDYEYYPTLKEYYTTVNSYYDFCFKPTGTFNQAKNTFAEYENKIRECRNDLDFIFED